MGPFAWTSQREVVMGLISHGPLPRSVEAIVEQQVRAFHARDSSERFVRHEPAPHVVTLSREFGAGGSAIARRVAEALGFTLWDDELTHHLAQRAGAHPRYVRAVDERARDLLDDVISTSLLGSPISGSAYRTLLVRTVREIGQRGAAVIVGRGANFLLPPEQGLRVRVVCPFKERVVRVAQRETLDLASAERRIREQDVERARFVRKLCEEDVGDPSHYDLVVNTRELDEEQAAVVILDAYEARFGAVVATAES
jgi:cytidylate kinase